MDLDQKAIIIDNGTGAIKAGFAADDYPTARFPAVIGKADPLRQREALVGLKAKEYYVGEEAQLYRGILSLDYPMQHGVVTDWDAMEKIWHHTFWKVLDAHPAEHPVLMTEAPQNPVNHRERMLDTLFEVFDVPAAYISIQAVLSLYASGKYTGVVCDSGDGVTHVVPIYEGYAIPSAIRRLDLAGRDLTEFLIRLMMEHTGVSLSSSSDFEIAREIKEECCYVKPDFDATIRELETADRQKLRTKIRELRSRPESRKELPDGGVVRLGPEAFICPEALFKPSLVGMDAPGIHKMIFDSIQKCQYDIRQHLLRDIVVSGGTTMFEGFEERVRREIVKLAENENVKREELNNDERDFPMGYDAARLNEPKVHAPAWRKYSVWIGGSILASLSAFQKMWITKADFQEKGAHRLIYEVFRPHQTEDASSSSDWRNY